MFRGLFEVVYKVHDLDAAKKWYSEILGFQPHIESPEMVAVQLNGEFVDKKMYADTIVRDNDSLEFLYFMGGGAGE